MHNTSLCGGPSICAECAVAYVEMVAGKIGRSEVVTPKEQRTMEAIRRRLDSARKAQEYTNRHQQHGRRR